MFHDCLARYAKSLFPFTTIFPLTVSNSPSDWVRIGGRGLELDDMRAMHCLQTKCNRFEAVGLCAKSSRNNHGQDWAVCAGSAEPELAFDAFVSDALYQFLEVEWAPVAGFARYTHVLAHFLLCL